MKIVINEIYMPGIDANADALNELFKALSTLAVCEPIHLEEKIIMPIYKTSLGIGIRMKRIGANVNKEDANEVETREESLGKRVAGGAVGGGVGVSPVAILIISKGFTGSEGVKVVSLSQPSEALFDD
jgi:uncharacterized spore protein YtfJ